MRRKKKESEAYQSNFQVRRLGEGFVNASFNLRLVQKYSIAISEERKLSVTEKEKATRIRSDTPGRDSRNNFH